MTNSGNTVRSETEVPPLENFASTEDSLLPCRLYKNSPPSNEKKKREHDNSQDYLEMDLQSPNPDDPESRLLPSQSDPTCVERGERAVALRGYTS